MGKIALAFLPTLLTLSIVGCVQDQAEQSTVIFSDPNIEAVIREAIDKPKDPINISDLEGLESLSLSGYDITDISPLSKCTNLKELYLVGSLMIPAPSTPNSDQKYGLMEVYPVGSETNDISPLSGLTNLVVLFLSYNQITDVSPLSRLTNLEVLDLDYNRIKDISPPSRLTKLKKLG